MIGLLQSTGWPTIVAIMGNWFGKGRYVFISLIMYICYIIQYMYVPYDHCWVYNTNVTTLYGFYLYGLQFYVL